MRKIFYIFVVALMSVIAFSSCSNNDPIEDLESEFTEVGRYSALMVKSNDLGVIQYAIPMTVNIHQTSDGRVVYRRAIFDDKHGQVTGYELYDVEVNNVAYPSEGNDADKLDLIGSYEHVIKNVNGNNVFLTVPDFDGGYLGPQGGDGQGPEGPKGTCDGDPGPKGDMDGNHAKVG